MKLAFWLVYLFFSPIRTEITAETKIDYLLHFEAQGCHYQILVNGEKLEEGKTYQKIERNYLLDKELIEDSEQNIEVNMFQISREMSLKTTQASLLLRLEKKKMTVLSSQKQFICLLSHTMMTKNNHGLSEDSFSLTDKLIHQISYICNHFGKQYNS